MNSPNMPVGPEYERRSYSIMRPEVEEAHELATMHNQSWLDTYPNEDAGISVDYIKEITAGRLTEQGLNRRRNNIEHAKEDDPTFFFRIAKNEAGDIVGFIDGFLVEDRYELAGLYTARETHGSGLAIQLWEAYKAWTDPTKPMWLTVVTYNERAKAFYRKIGFKELPQTERLYEGTLIPVIDMERPPEQDLINKF